MNEAFSLPEALVGAGNSEAGILLSPRAAAILELWFPDGCWKLMSCVAVGSEVSRPSASEAYRPSGRLNRSSVWSVSIL